MNFKLNKPKKALKAKFTKRVGSFFGLVFFSFFIALSPLLFDFGKNPTGIYRQKVNAEPNYSVTWSNNKPGQYPLKIKSSWFKSYETKEGKKTAANNTIPITKEQASSGPVNDKTLFVTINEGVFQSNKECEVQLLVQRPIQSESTITVDAYKPSQQGDSPACSDALISSMAKVVEPDGDNTVQGPARDNDPNTDTQNQTDQDRENVENAQRDAENEAQNAKSCEEEFGISAGWLVCGVLEFVSSTIDKLFDAVDSLLSVDALALSSNTGLRTSWSYFRGIATFSLLAIGLVMVLSQAIGGGKR